MDVADRRRRYVAAAVTDELDRVRSAGSGGRNHALNRAAYALGALVGAGGLDEDDARAALLDAAHAAGLSRAEARATIRSGLSRGRANPRELPAANGDEGWRYRPPNRSTPVPPETPPAYPDPAEVGALWSACLPLAAARWAEPVVPWLVKRRGLVLDILAALDLARVLPDTSHPWPRWVPTLGLSRAAWLAVYRLAVPVYDCDGRMRALRFRAADRRMEPDGGRMRWVAPPGCVVGEDGALRGPPGRDDGRPVLPKSLSPRGGTRGLVMADPMALALLRGAREDDSTRWDGWAYVVEGEPAYLAAAGNPARLRDGTTYAVLGVEAGAWTAEVAARVPDGAHVVVWTDHDAAGERYADTIIDTLGARCDVRRVTRPPEAA